MSPPRPDPAASAAVEAGKPKSVAAQGKSGAKTPAKRVARRANSASSRRKPAAKRWQPTAGDLLRADLWRKEDPGGLKILVEQACRVADRLQSLDHALRGGLEAVLALDVGRIIAQETPEGERKAFSIELGLKVDGAVAEERQQAKLFSSLLSDIHRQRAKLPLAPQGDGDGEGGEDDDLDGLD